MTTPTPAPGAAPAAAGPRVHFIQHKGKQILLHDFSNLLRLEDTLAAIAESRALVRKQPLNSVLTLTDVTGSRFNREIVEALKELTKGNKPHVKAGAIVGMTGIQRVVYVAVTQFTGRRLPTFGSLEEAKDHLVGVA
jgi:hypothetical protein